VALTGIPKTEEVGHPSQEQCQKQVQRILHSSSFRNASMLQQLFQYLAAKAYDHGGDTLKEYTIGVEAFGRPNDFDPKTDTIVRVQIHRLRQKLKEYYETDGIHDPIVVDIPKGHYLPFFEGLESPDAAFGHEPVAGRDSTSSNGHIAEDTSPHGDQEHRRAGMPFAVNVMIAVAAGIAIFAAGLWIGSERLRTNSTSSAAIPASQQSFDKSSDPVKAFWAHFLGNDPNPVIAYPDAVFLLDNFNDLFRFRWGATDFRGAPVDPHVAREFASNPELVAKAGQLYYENSYLGFGELQAVAMLSNLFGQMGLKPIVKPSRELTGDDLKLHNVIMLGSPSQNLAVAQLAPFGDFSFQNPNGRLEQWRGLIVNAHPRPNEASTYRTERDPNTQVLKADYGLITVEPGTTPGRYIANLGGLDTTGSEGTVLFATSRQGIVDLSRALAAAGKSGNAAGFPTFQALLRVPLEKGYDVLGASLVTVHVLQSPQAVNADDATTRSALQ
jgi:hypothetical protein